MEHGHADAVPQVGDVVICRVAGTPALYALRVIPRAYQIVFDTYSDARMHAERFARWQRVDVWTASKASGEGGEQFFAAASHRPPVTDSDVRTRLERIVTRER